MAAAAELAAAQKLADLIGWPNALMLAAWAGGHAVSIPVRASKDHTLVRLIGSEAVEALAARGEPTISVPSLSLKEVRLRGQVHRLAQLGISAAQTAELTGTTRRTVQRHLAALRGRGRMFTGESETPEPETPRAPPGAPGSVTVGQLLGMEPPLQPERPPPREARRRSHEGDPRAPSPKPPRPSPVDIVRQLEAERLQRACEALRHSEE